MGVLIPLRMVPPSIQMLSGLLSGANGIASYWVSYVGGSLGGVNLFASGTPLVSGILNDRHWSVGAVVA